MDPEFGSIIWDMIFETFNDATINLVEEDVRAIIGLDSRVEIESLIVDEFEFGISIEVTLLYKPWQVVDTFSLDFDRRTLSAIGDA